MKKESKKQLPNEHSAGIIIYLESPRLYLLLHYGFGHWDFAKGHIEQGENALEAAKRELFEETGIVDFELINGFNETIKYYFKKGNGTIHKDVVYFLAKTKQFEIKLSDEHSGYLWLPIEEAIKQATFKNAKELLEKAEKIAETL